MLRVKPYPLPEPLRKKKSGEDIYIFCGVDYPGAHKSGFIPEHRYIMQLKLGRVLTRTEDVHHKDHNHDNNKPKNLVAKQSLDHKIEHGFNYARRGQMCRWR